MFSGDFIVARRRTSLFDLPLVSRIDPGCDEYDEEGELRVCQRRPGGWQVVTVGYGLPDGRDWLRAMVTATRRPVMIASIHHDRLGVVRGLEPGSAGSWSVRLHAESRESSPNREGQFPAQPPGWMLAGPHLSGTAAVDAVAGWSAAAGTGGDRVRLAEALAGKPEYSIESVFFRLLDAAGLGDPIDEPYDGSGHLLPDGWLDPAKLERSIRALKPGMQRALECLVHPGCFAKVRLRSDGDYELEYCDPSREQHCLAVAPSLDEVLAAMGEWAASEIDWRDVFQWTEIGTS